MFTSLTIWILFLLLGISVLLNLYGRFLDDLERHNADTFDAIGRPRLFMVSPTRGVRLQKFLYSGSQAEHIHPSVAKRARLLRIITPLFVLAVFIGYLWVTNDILARL